MAIPRASIPQANIQQAQPLLAQFNAARASAQGLPVPAIQGQGIDPAQLIAMAQGNALKVNNSLNGQANQFIATDPAVDIRARERYLESLEKDTQAANRLDNRTVYNADRTDAQKIFTAQQNANAAALLAEQNSEAAKLLAKQNDLRAQLGIDAANATLDRDIADRNAREKRLTGKENAAHEREKNWQLELAEHKDSLARQLNIDKREMERLEQDALQAKFGGHYAQELNKISRYWGEPGKPGTRFQQIQDLKQAFLASGALQDPELFQRFSSTSPEYAKIREGLETVGAIAPGAAVPMNASGLMQALSKFAMQEIDTGGPLSAKFYSEYARQIAQQDAAARQMYNTIMMEAVKRGVVPQASGTAPNQAPVPGGGVPTQSGSIPGAVPVPPGNALTPSAPPSATTAPPQAPPPAGPPPQPSPPQAQAPVGSSGLTNAQASSIMAKFPDADADGDRNLTADEIAAFIDNPLIDEGTRQSAVDAMRYLGGGAILYNTLRNKETGTALAQSIIDNEVKVLGDNPAIDPDSQKFEQERVKQESLKPTDKDAKLIAKEESLLKSDQKDLAKVNKGLAKRRALLNTAKGKVKNIDGMIAKQKTAISNFSAQFGNSLSPLGSHNLKGEDKVKMQKLETELARRETMRANAQADVDRAQSSVDKALDDQAKVRDNINNSKQAVANAKGRAARISNNPNQAQVRSGISKEVSQANMAHNSRMRSIGTKFGVTEAEISKLVDPADGRISQSALRDIISKQELGSVSHRIKRIVTYIKANPKGLALKSGKLLGGLAIMAGPEIYDVVNSVFEDQTEKELAIKEFTEMIEAYKELNQSAQPNPLTAGP